MLMEIFMKVNGNLIKPMEKELILMLMGQSYLNKNLKNLIIRYEGEWKEDR